MTRRLHEAMRKHFALFRFAKYEGDSSPLVFHHIPRYRRGSAKLGARVKSFRTRMKHARDAAKLPEGWVPHDLRHRRVTTWLAGEKNPVHVKEAMGHSDLRVTMSYTHFAREHLRSLVEEKDGVSRGAEAG